MKTNFRKIAYATFMVLFTVTFMAQNDKGFYVGLNTGFGANSGASTNLAPVLGIYNSTEISSSVESIEIKKIGLGKGLNVGLLAGYMFNKNIGVELGINYLMGSTTEFNNNYLNGASKITEIKGKVLQFKPTVVLSAGMSKINPYAKLGLTLGNPKAEITTNSNDPANAEFFETVAELTGKMALGFHGGMGLNYNLNSKITLFAEILYTGLTFRPENSKFTKATENGVNVLPLIDVVDKETIFVTDILTNAPNNSNLPSRSPAIDIPFNNVTLNIGLKYGF